MHLLFQAHVVGAPQIVDDNHFIIGRAYRPSRLLCYCFIDCHRFLFLLWGATEGRRD